MSIRFSKAIATFGPVIYGTQEKTVKQITTAILRGYRVLDSATAYNTAPIIRQAIDMARKESNERPLVIAKFNSGDFPNIQEIVTKHDEELGFKPDAVLLHSASNKLATQDENDVETLRVYNFLTEYYKDKMIGVSNFNIHQLKNLLDNEFHPVMNSIEVSPFFQPNQLIQFCKQNDILITAYRLTSKGKIYNLELNNSKIHDVTNKSLKWAYDQELIPIISSSSEEHMISILNYTSTELDNDTKLLFDSCNMGKSGSTCMLRFVNLEEFN